MDQRRSSSSPIFLWLAIVTIYLTFVIVGTLAPWPTAVAKLAAIGTGPYVPVAYSSLTSDTRAYRTQIYIVASQIGSSWSTYRVTEDNNTANVEEVRDGILYFAAFTIAFVLAAILGLRRSAGHD